MVQIIYATKTQHSRKLAEAIGKELKVKAVSTAECTQTEKFDLLFLVGGIYAGKCNPELLSYAEKLDPSLVKNVVLVTSSVSVSQRSQKELRSILAEKKINVLNEITCPGGFLFVKFNHPNKQDIKDIASAARSISDKFSISMTA